jgi:pyrimidine operon attenuation protein/uracil phosphoribosyltransferase
MARVALLPTVSGVLGSPSDREVSPVRLIRTEGTTDVAERERRLTPPFGGVFVARKRVMTPEDVDRAVWRMGHEIAERNRGLDDVVLVGLQTGGVPLAHRLAEALQRIEGADVSVGSLDVAFYRDDIGLRPVLPEAASDIPFDLTGLNVVLVDDVLFTGRTIRAALDALADHGRARAVQLAVMVDRGHRELPIRPDYVGKNLPTRRDEVVNVTEEGVDLGEMVK